MRSAWVIGLVFAFGMLAGGAVLLALQVYTWRRLAARNREPDGESGIETSPPTLLEALSALAAAGQDSATGIREALLGIQKNVQSVTPALGRVEAQLERCVRELERQKPQPERANAAGGVAFSPPAREPAESSGRIQPPLDSSPPPSEAIEDVIAANFRAIDLETQREFSAFRRRFLSLLGGQVVDVQDQGEGVLFIEPAGRALAWPWSNAYLRPPWRDWFDVPRGVNYPVAAVGRPAVVEPDGAGGWRCVLKGAVQQ